MSHTHQVRKSVTRCFSGAVGPAADQNPAAHGNVTEIETCACGAVRKRNVNGGHEEVGTWDLPEWVFDANMQAMGTTASEARRYLLALARSTAGRRAFDGAGYGAIADSPDRGDDVSTLIIARAVERVLREQVRS